MSIVNTKTGEYPIFPRGVISGSFNSSKISDAALAGYNLARVTPTPRPDYDPSTQQVSVSAEQDAGGQWVEVWTVSDKPPVILSRAEIARQVRDKARQVRDGGTTINGMEIATDVDARSRILGAKVNPKTTRKVVTRGGRAKMTGQELNAIADAMDDFLQSVDDREYDLLEQIDAATDDELPGVDIESGWPE